MAGRPKKPPKLKMDSDLRIPVTTAQKQLIAKAVATTERGEIASWARGILVRAAEDLINDNRKRKKQRKAGDSNPPAKAGPSGGV